MRTVVTPPRVSIPRDSGVTSSRRTSFTSPASTPPWIAAPIATTSSGFTPLCGSLPKKPFTTSCTFGIRVWPPTRMTSSMFDGLSPASLSACSIGGMVRFTRSSTSCSSFARVSVMFKCLGRLVRRDEGEVDFRLHHRGQLHLGLLGGFLEPLQRHRVLGQVDPLVALELGHQPLDDARVKIVAAQVRVAIGRLHLEHALGELEDRDVVRAAAQVVD